MLKDTPKADLSHYQTVAKNNGLECSTTEGGTFKMVNQEAIIYVKPCLGFYRSEHNPSICWRGSGFALTQEKKNHILENEVFIAQLQKDESILYTAWWYESKDFQTTNQWRWRKHLFQQKGNIFLINITCESPEQLEKEVCKWFHEKAV